jgi:hypothetical protein
MVTPLDDGRDDPVKNSTPDLNPRVLSLAPKAGVVLAVLCFGCTGADASAPQGYDFVPAVEHVQTGSPEITITSLSARSDMVSGGDLLIRADLPREIDPQTVMIERNGIDVSDAFRAEDEGGGLLGLVTGLDVGDNVIRISTGAPSSVSAELTVTNYPAWGPVFAGPHEQPFFCTTDTFELAAGGTLGPPLDEYCSAEPRVDYVYRTGAGRIAPLPATNGLPDDVSYTTTMDGRRVPFVVRIETGTANRAIYEIAMLHDPREASPDPWNRSAGWNGKLIYRFGGGCRPGWYQQGTRTGGVLDDHQLSRGYGVASATLNVFANNCSELLAAETMMLVKERFIEAYGPPQFTIGWGSSGGAFQQFGIADNQPGLLDGLVVGSSFPDVSSGTVFKSVDARLMEHYFGQVAPGRFTAEQKRAISGFGVLASIPAMSVMARRTDPLADFADVMPEESRYHPESNPTGARATIYDHTVNVYGRDPSTGFARRPLDNLGVQYGLGTLNDGVIDVAQFLDLNEGIGGLDDDFLPQLERHVGDLAAIEASYRTGRIISGRALANVPIVDFRAYLDLQENGDNHMKLHTFSLRERLIREHGHTDNHVLLLTHSGQRFGFGSSYSSTETNEVLYGGLAQIDRWLTAVSRDTSGDPLPERVVRARPRDLVDACWTKDGRKIVEKQSYDGPGRCGELYPSFPVPLLVAGAPLVDDIAKCQLKPLDLSDYAVSMNEEEWARLGRIFPEGVCDWTRPGVGQQAQTGVWLAARSR